MYIYELKVAISHQYFFPILWGMILFVSIKWFFGYRKYEKYCRTFVPPISPLGYTKYMFLDIFVVGVIIFAGFTGQIWYCGYEKAEVARQVEFKTRTGGGSPLFLPI